MPEARDDQRGLIILTVHRHTHIHSHVLTAWSRVKTLPTPIRIPQSRPHPHPQNPPVKTLNYNEIGPKRSVGKLGSQPHSLPWTFMEKDAGE